MLPRVKTIDQTIGDALQALVDDYATATDDVKNPLNVPAIVAYLEGHPDNDILVALIRYGSPLGLKPGLNPKRLSKRIHNFITTKEECLKMIQKMHKELQKGQIVPGWGWYQLNLLCVPKKNGETGLMTEIRVARHGSYPKVGTKYISLNDGITEEAKRTKLPQFHDYVRQLYPYFYASLRDLKDAFRQLLLALDDREYVQYCIFGLRFRDLRVAYGEAAAAARCQEFTSLLIWICEHKLPEYKGKPNRMSVHIDDFLIVAKTATECATLAAAFDRLCKELHINISIEKNEDCVQRGVVHGFGFKLDSAVKTVYVPTDKACDLTFGAITLLKYRYATAAALESLTGKIMHWTKLKRRAKVLCNRSIRQIHDQIRDKIPKYDKPYIIIPVDEGTCLDIALFLKVFRLFREVPMTTIIYEPTISISASTDASSTGGGFVCGGIWYGYEFRDTPNRLGRTHKAMHINLQEAHAVLMMIHHNRYMLTGRRLWLFIDNQSCMYGIINAWSRSRAMLDFVQEIAMLQMLYCIDIRLDYLASELNWMSDLLSRGERATFLELIACTAFELEEATDVDYYDHLRIMHGPEELPDWLQPLEHLLTQDTLPSELAPELTKIFNDDLE